MKVTNDNGSFALDVFCSSLSHDKFIVAFVFRLNLAVVIKFN